MAAILKLAPLAFDLPAHFDITLENVEVSNEGGQTWITGAVKVHADAFGNGLDTEVRSFTRWWG
jgi:hypothetical protein